MYLSSAIILERARGACERKQADELRLNEAGSIAALVQDSASKEVPTHAYMTRESHEKTLETKATWWYSRLRQELWHKGKTAGNTQNAKGLRSGRYQRARGRLVAASSPTFFKLLSTPSSKRQVV
ncbi:hypothetical protein I9X38_19100 [Bacillus mojavensis]|nr:hypothetical protein I9X38_19100 [Bacillus mojavensis]